MSTVLVDGGTIAPKVRKLLLHFRRFGVDQRLLNPQDFVKQCQNDLKGKELDDFNLMIAPLLRQIKAH